MCLWVYLFYIIFRSESIIICVFYRFGVCCVHIIDDDDNTDVNHNDTYIQNPNFPSAYDEDNGITYKVNKVNDGLLYQFVKIQ